MMPIAVTEQTRNVSWHMMVYVICQHIPSQLLEALLDNYQITEEVPSLVLISAFISSVPANLFLFLVLGGPEIT